MIRDLRSEGLVEAKLVNEVGMRIRESFDFIKWVHSLYKDPVAEWNMAHLRNLKSLLWPKSSEYKGD